MTLVTHISAGWFLRELRLAVHTKDREILVSPRGAVGSGDGYKSLAGFRRIYRHGRYVKTVPLSNDWILRI